MYYIIIIPIIIIIIIVSIYCSAFNKNVHVKSRLFKNNNNKLTLNMKIKTNT